MDTYVNTIEGKNATKRKKEKRGKYPWGVYETKQNTQSYTPRGYIKTRRQTAKGKRLFLYFSTIPVNYSAMNCRASCFIDHGYYHT